MLKRLAQLSFTIGLFFTIVGAILMIGYFISAILSSPLNLYAGITFLVFGILMMTISPKEKENN